MISPSIRRVLPLNPPRTGREIASTLETIAIFARLPVSEVFTGSTQHIGGVEVVELRFAQDYPAADVAIYAAEEETAPYLQVDTQYESIVVGNAEPTGPVRAGEPNVPRIEERVEYVKDRLNEQLNR